MPDLADEAFAAVGERLRDRVELLPLHPAYRACFPWPVASRRPCAR